MLLLFCKELFDSTAAGLHYATWQPLDCSGPTLQYEGMDPKRLNKGNPTQLGSLRRFI